MSILYGLHQGFMINKPNHANLIFVLGIFMHLKVLFIFTCLVSASSLFAAAPVPSEEQSHKTIESIYQQLHQEKKLAMPERLEKISRFFLTKPYYLGALGEGSAAEFDQFPLYRVDAFDCLTFVETVLAIALADNLTAFEKMILNIRYEKGNVSFLTRNHFTDLDWNLNNQRNQLLQDITFNIKNEQHKSVAQYAQALIDKPSWYHQLKPDRIRIFPVDEAKQMRRLAKLKQEGQRLPTKLVKIPYLPLTALFNHQGEPNRYLFKQIPQGAIIEIIRPDWDLKKVIGTNLNVSHLGFAFWSKGELVFRNASTIKGSVVDQSLIEYLHGFLQSPTIKGINVEVVR